VHFDIKPQSVTLQNNFFISFFHSTMKIVAIKEFDNTKQAPLLPLIPEPTKVSNKDNLTLIEIST